MLASERRNHTSFWRPYLDTLPARPSTGWFMKPQESADTLKRLGVQAASALGPYAPVRMLRNLLLAYVCGFLHHRAA